MTTYYVDSAAGGDNDGSTPEHAWTSLASSTGVAAGSEILVDDGHSEDPGASVTYNWANGTIAAPVKIVCADLGTAGYPLSTGASVAQTVAARSMTLRGNIYVDGMTFSAADSLSLSGNVQRFKNCNLNIVVSNAARYIIIAGSVQASSTGHFENCAFSLNYIGQYLMLGTSTGRAFLRNCMISVPESHDYLFSINARLSCLEVSCCSLPSATSLINIITGGATVHFKRCSIGTYTNFVVTHYSGESCLILESCKSGTISATPETFTRRHTNFGQVVSTTAKYRTGGASDGANSYSFEMTPSASAEEQIGPIETPPITRWVEGGSPVTFTVYVAGPAEMYDDEVWMELEGPDDTTPNTTTRGYWYSSRLGWRGSRTVLTTDSVSTWNGSDVSTKRKISHTYTPQQDGPVVIRVCYAKTSSAAIVVDPVIEVS